VGERKGTGYSGAPVAIPVRSIGPPNHSIDVDQEEDKIDALTVAPGAIGAGTEIGRATP
jgi:hypothetical protein